MVVVKKGKEEMEKNSLSVGRGRKRNHTLKYLIAISVTAIFVFGMLLPGYYAHLEKGLSGGEDSFNPRFLGSVLKGWGWQKAFAAERVTGSADSEASAYALTIASDYTLTRDIGPCDAGGILIAADNIILDGNGHKIIGSRTTGSIGIYLKGRKGVTIKNCDVSQFVTGLIVTGGNDNKLIKNNIHHNNRQGLTLSNTFENVLLNNRAESNGDQGVHLSGATQNALINNTFSGNSLQGIFLMHNSNHNLFMDNTIYDNPTGICIKDSSHNLVKGNLFKGPIHVVADSHNNLFIDNKVIGTGIRFQVYTEESPFRYPGENTVIGGVIKDAPQAVSFHSSRGNKIINLIVINCQSDIYSRSEHRPSKNTFINCVLNEENTDVDEKSVVEIRSAEAYLADPERFANKWEKRALLISKEEVDVDRISGSKWSWDGLGWPKAFGAETGSADSEAAGYALNITSDYTLTRDLGPCDAGGIYIGADNITLDGNGHKIIGTRTRGPYGIYLKGRKGVTIKNCDVSNFVTGVVLEDCENITFVHNNIHDSDNEGPKDNVGWGMRAYRSNNNILSNNIIATSGDRGITLYGSSHNLLKYNTFKDNLRQAVYIGGRSHYNILISNTATTRFKLGKSGGFRISEGPEHNILLDNSATGGTYGIYLKDTNHNIVKGGYFDNMCRILADSHHNTLIDIKLVKSGGVGLRFDTFTSSRRRPPVRIPYSNTILGGVVKGCDPGITFNSAWGNKIIGLKLIGCDVPIFAESKYGIADNTLINTALDRDRVQIDEKSVLNVLP